MLRKSKVDADIHSLANTATSGSRVAPLKMKTARRAHPRDIMGQTSMKKVRSQSNDTISEFYTHDRIIRSTVFLKERPNFLGLSK